MLTFCGWHGLPINPPPAPGTCHGKASTRLQQTPSFCSIAAHITDHASRDTTLLPAACAFEAAHPPRFPPFPLGPATNREPQTSFTDSCPASSSLCTYRYSTPVLFYTGPPRGITDSSAVHPLPILTPVVDSSLQHGRVADTCGRAPRYCSLNRAK